jgi:hypothetical protein
MRWARKAEGGRGVSPGGALNMALSTEQQKHSCMAIQARKLHALYKRFTIKGVQPAPLPPEHNVLAVLAALHLNVVRQECELVVQLTGTRRRDA